jgi:hypothetical protein
LLSGTPGGKREDLNGADINQDFPEDTTVTPPQTSKKTKQSEMYIHIGS